LTTFLYEAVIVELALEPSVGPSAGGTVVVLTGRGYQAGATVTFAGVPGTAVTVVSSERITVTTPAHAIGPVDVVVTNPDASTGTLTDGFTYEDVAPDYAVGYRTPGGAAAASIRTETNAPKITQALGEPSKFTFSARTEPAGESRVEFRAFGRSLFLGTVTNKLERVDGAERLQVWDTEAIDLTHRLSRRRPIGEWIDTSGTTVLVEAMAVYAPGFSTAGVEGGLPNVTIKADGSADLWAFIVDVCERCGAKAFLDGTALHVFTLDSGFDPPDDVTEANPDLQWTEPGQPITIEWDYTQIRNRITVRGSEGLTATLDDPASIALYDVTEFTINDDTLTTVPELLARAQAELDAWAFPIPIAHYATRDLKTRAGKTVIIDIARPLIDDTFLITAVTIDQLELVLAGERPRFTVTAKPATATMRSAGDVVVGLLQTVVDLKANAAKQPRLAGDVVSEPGGRTTIPEGSIGPGKLAGCIGSELLDPTGVTADTYGDDAHLTSYTVDAAGRIMAAETDPVAVVKTDGSQAFTANQPLGGHKLTGLGAPTSAGDAATKAYVDAATPTLPSGLILDDGTVPFAADQSMGGFALTDVADPVNPQDAATMAYVDGLLVSGAMVRGEVPSGAVNGSNAVYTTAAAYGTTLAVYLNGIRQKLTTDYTETTSTTFTMVTPPVTGDLLLVDYGEGAGGGGGGGGGTGGLVLLESHTAAASATLDFATRNATGQSGATFQSDYDEYELVFENVLPATNGAILLLRASTNGGSSYDAANNYAYSYQYSNQAGSGGTPGSGAASGIFSGGTTSNTASGGGICGSMRITNPLNAAQHKIFDGHVAFFANDGNRYRASIGGWYLSTTAVDALRVLFDSGNLTSGTVRLYGVAK
jgi:hypothetical protein